MGDAPVSFEPLIYRQIIDDVITNIKTEFDDYGVSEDILSDLQSVSLSKERLWRMGFADSDIIAEMGEQGDSIECRRV